MLKCTLGPDLCQMAQDRRKFRREMLFVSSFCRLSALATGGTSRRMLLFHVQTHVVSRLNRQTRGLVFSSDFHDAFEALKEVI